MQGMSRGCKGIAGRRVIKRTPFGAVSQQDELCVEEHVLFFVNGGYLGRTIHTPGHDLDLAYGFAFVEGAIRSAADVAEVAFTRPSRGLQRAEITLTEQGARRWEQAGSREPWRGVDMPGPRVEADIPQWTVSSGELSAMMRAMESAQVIFPRTGGAHCAALFTKKGERLAQAEDIGRHNALDKVIGAVLRAGQLDAAAIGVMSSRLSWELVRKASAAGLGLLTGISAAASLAAETAEACGLTLVGRLRNGAMTVYCHGERISRTEPAAQRTALRQPPRLAEAEADNFVIIGAAARS